jgi:hypothetical protein
MKLLVMQLNMEGRIITFEVATTRQLYLHGKNTRVEIPLQEALLPARLDMQPRCKAMVLGVVHPEDGCDIFLRNVDELGITS